MHAWIVLTGGLLIFLRWVLIRLNLRNSSPALKVWLVIMRWVECECDGVIEVRRSRKETKADSIGGGMFWEVDNMREWFRAYGCFETTWCCLLVLCLLCLLQETEYSFMSREQLPRKERVIERERKNSGSNFMILLNIYKIE